MRCIGIDIFIKSTGTPKMPQEVSSLKLELISNRGTAVPLDGSEPGFMCVDWYRCRYLSKTELQEAQVLALIEEISSAMEWEKIQKLYADGETQLFSGAHGQ